MQSSNGIKRKLSQNESTSKKKMKLKNESSDKDETRKLKAELLSLSAELGALDEKLKKNPKSRANQSLTPERFHPFYFF